MRPATRWRASRDAGAFETLPPLAIDQQGLVQNIRFQYEEKWQDAKVINAISQKNHIVWSEMDADGREDDACTDASPKSRIVDNRRSAIADN